MTRNPCYVFDIDGTPADCAHLLHHIDGAAKDWDAFFADCVKDLPPSTICATSCGTGLT